MSACPSAHLDVKLSLWGHRRGLTDRFPGACLVCLVISVALWNSLEASHVDRPVGTVAVEVNTAARLCYNWTAARCTTLTHCNSPT